MRLRQLGQHDTQWHWDRLFNKRFSSRSLPQRYSIYMQVLPQPLYPVVQMVCTYPSGPARAQAKSLHVSTAQPADGHVAVAAWSAYCALLASMVLVHQKVTAARACALQAAMALAGKQAAYVTGRAHPVAMEVRDLHLLSATGSVRLGALAVGDLAPVSVMVLVHRGRAPTLVRRSALSARGGGMRQRAEHAMRAN